jgi:hypothetical protein
MTPVPQIDWMNQNLYRSSYEEGDLMSRYTGPSFLVHRIVAATMAQGKLLAIPPPASNSSWSLNFWGPAIRCGEVSDLDRTSISDNYGAYVQESSNAGLTTNYLPSYFSWANGLLPVEVAEFGGDMRIDTGPKNDERDSATLYVAYNAEWGFSTINDYPIDLTDNATVRSLGGWTEIFRNMTLVRCDLYNSSYLLELNYTNGVQEAAISRPDASSSDILPSTEIDLYSPMDMDETWKWGCPSETNDILVVCLDVTKAKLMSYQAINDAFNSFLVGQLASLDFTGDSSVVRSVLTYRGELAFLRNQYSLPNIDTFTGNNTARPLASGRLRDSPERLYENVVVSILSDPFLQ